MLFPQYHQSFTIMKIILVVIVVVFLARMHTHYSSRYNCDGTHQIPLPLLTTRNDLVIILRAEGLQKAAEIGVQQGFYAHYLLSNWPGCTEYHAIDLWKQQASYTDKANVPDKQQEDNYAITRQRLQKWENIVRYHRNYSNLAVHEIEDGSLDFIYIDARHDYIGVSEDMELYWPKLKCGGIFSGHDLLDAHEVSDQDWSLDYRGVRRTDGKAVKSAVIEFAFKHKRQMLRTSESWPTWYFRK